MSSSLSLCLQFDVALAEQLDGTALAGDADEGQLDVPGQVGVTFLISLVFSHPSLTLLANTLLNEEMIQPGS